MQCEQLIVICLSNVNALMSDRTEEVIANGQSRGTDHIGFTRHRTKTKKKLNNTAQHNTTQHNTT